MPPAQPVVSTESLRGGRRFEFRQQLRERAMRPIDIGRKTELFVGSERTERGKGVNCQVPILRIGSLRLILLCKLPKRYLVPFSSCETKLLPIYW